MKNKAAPGKIEAAAAAGSAGEREGEKRHKLWT